VELNRVLRLFSKQTPDSLCIADKSNLGGYTYPDKSIRGIQWRTSTRCKSVPLYGGHSFINGACDLSSCSTFEDSRQQQSFSGKRKGPGSPSEHCSAVVTTKAS